jgi:hypothetical protein
MNKTVIKTVSISGVDWWVDKIVASHFPDGKQEILGGGVIEISTTMMEDKESGKQEG